MNFWTKFVLIISSFVPLFSVSAFGDIMPEDPHRHFFEHLRDTGIMTPFGDGNFYPAYNVTRAEALTVAMRAGQITFPEYQGQIYFNDVDPNQWYAPIVARAVEVGVVDDIHPNFRPSDAVSKAEFLTFLFRATAVNLKPYQSRRDIAADIPNNSWMTPYFAYAKRYQIAHIDANNNYLPSRLLTRREVGVMTYRQLRVYHGNVETKELIELQVALQQFLSHIKAGRNQDAEFEVHRILKINEKIVRTRNNQDAIATQAISKAMKHLSESLRSFRYGKNLDGIASLHLAIQQTERAAEKSEKMKPFADELTLLINETLLTFSGRSGELLTQLDSPILTDK